MKWQLDLTTGLPSRERADTRRWPYRRFNESGVRLCQRTNVDGFSMTDWVSGAASSFGDPVGADGYSARFKVRSRGPDEQSVLRSFWERPWRKYYVAEFNQAPPAGAHVYQSFGGGFPMSDVMVIVKQELDGSRKLWSCLTSAIDSSGSYPSESIHFDERLDIDSSYTTFPQYSYRGRFSCQRILIFEDIAHDGDAYPDSVLRAPIGTAPPGGPTWRLRHKGNGTYSGGELVSWNADSDIRFEPFSWPAPGYTDLRRYLASYWSSAGASLPVDGASTTGGEMFGNVSCQHVEGVTDPINARISGHAMLRRFEADNPAFGSSVPAGWKHTLIVDASVWLIHQWIKADAGSAVVWSKYAMMGIYGRCVAIV